MKKREDKYRRPIHPDTSLSFAFALSLLVAEHVCCRCSCHRPRAPPCAVRCCPAPSAGRTRPPACRAPRRATGPARAVRLHRCRRCRAPSCACEPPRRALPNHRLPAPPPCSLSLSLRVCANRELEKNQAPEKKGKEREKKKEERKRKEPAGREARKKEERKKKKREKEREKEKKKRKKERKKRGKVGNFGFSSDSSSFFSKAISRWYYFRTFLIEFSSSSVKVCLDVDVHFGDGSW
ncbi:uncharacterized protein LOC133910723 [Phragmites australis]|uniref:uncharacterized protein LOC133910723 n=1 Tax=Phragmites australis TaxID=29695 RepID=UPI002D7681F3|nr:uncharacterized protein LOC133910723 [Phragmites australis]